MAHRIREVSFDLMRSDECLVSERYGRQNFAYVHVHLEHNNLEPKRWFLPLHAGIQSGPVVRLQLCRGVVSCLYIWTMLVTSCHIICSSPTGGSADSL